MEINWTLLLSLLAIPALIALAVVWIYFQDRKVMSWKEAPGRIVSSKPIARTIREKHVSTPINAAGTNDIDTSEALETHNFADIRYEFRVGPKTYAGNRISLARDPGNFEVAEVLKRYPEGKIVTVVYDPTQPNSCLLERDDPKNIRIAWAVVAGLTIFILAAFFASGPLVDYADRAMAQTAPRPLVVTLTIFALFIAFFAHAVGRQTRAMKKWPKTTGQIIRSMVETTARTHHQANSTKTTTTTMYVPRVVYKFEVGGNVYQGDNIGGSASSNTPTVAEKIVARFDLYAPVAVHYNPQNPSESTLDVSAGYVGAGLWATAALFAIAAYALAGGSLKIPWG